MEKYLVNILGTLFLLTSIIDAIKYHWNAVKIRNVNSAKGHSRKFINAAILNDIVRMAYGFSIHDWYIVASSALAMIFMCELFFVIYWYYPYRKRNRKDFKRPGILPYLWNSILPNDKTKRL
jgi:cbb3-type cytochrome oxidase subunit 3